MDEKSDTEGETRPLSLNSESVSEPKPSNETPAQTHELQSKSSETPDSESPEKNSLPVSTSPTPKEFEDSVTVKVSLSPEHEQEQRVPESFEVDARRRLIAQVEKYPNIWQYGHPSYRHWGMAQESWEKISNVVAMPVDECRQIWNRIRARYASNRTLSVKAKNKLRYFHSLSFLEENFKKSSTERKADKSKTRKYDFMNLTNLLETELTEFPNTGFIDEFDSMEETKEAKLILLDQLKTYDKSKKLCILCNHKAKYEDKLFPYTGSNKKNISIIRDWKRSNAISLCQVLGLDANKYLEFFVGICFCKSCHQLVLDVDYWSNSIKSFQLKLDSTRQQIENILVTNYCTDPSNTKGEKNHVQDEEQPPKMVSVKEEAVTEAEVSEVEDNFIAENSKEAHPDEENPIIRPRKNSKPQKKRRSKRKAVEVFTRSGRRVQVKQEYSSESEASEEFEPETEIEESLNPKLKGSYASNNTPLKKRKITMEVDEAMTTTTKTAKEVKKVPIRFYCKKQNCNYSCKSEYLVEVHVNKDHLDDPTPYHCNFGGEEECDQKFRTSGLLNVHKIRDHASGQSHGGKKKCQYCGKIFGARGLSQHLEQQHSEYQLKPKCSTCLKAFSTQTLVEEHEQLHRAKLVHQFTCVLCENDGDCVFQDKLDLQRHVQNVHEEGLFKCFPCDIVFLTKNRLKHHVYRHHSRESRPELKCKHCDFQAQQPSSLRYHLQKHSVTMDFKCDFPGCDANYKWQAALKRHKISHTDHRPFECNICGKTFHQESYLRRHQVYHLDLRPFMCEICSSSYKTRKHLTRHMKAHEKDPYGIRAKNSKPRKPRLQQILTHSDHDEDPVENETPPGINNTTVLEVMQIVDVDDQGTSQFTLNEYEGTYVHFN